MESILSDISTYGYIGLFLYSIGGGFLGIIAASVLSYAGKLDFTYVLIISIISNFIGDIILFYLARYQKKDIQKYINKNKKYFSLSSLLMKKYGDKVIFIQKFIWGIKTLIPIMMGLSKYNIKRFIFLNFFASIFFVLIIGFASYYSGTFIISIYNYIINNKSLIPIIYICIIMIVVGYFLYNIKKRKNKKYK